MIRSRRTRRRCFNGRFLKAVAGTGHLVGTLDSSELRVPATNFWARGAHVPRSKRTIQPARRCKLAAMRIEMALPADRHPSDLAAASLRSVAGSGKKLPLGSALAFYLAKLLFSARQPILG